VATPDKRNIINSQRGGQSARSHVNVDSRDVEPRLDVGLGNSGNLSMLIQNAVSAGIDLARKQWEGESARHKTDDQSLRLISSVAALNDRLQAIEAKLVANDAQSKIAQLEQRIVKLEAALMATTFQGHNNGGPSPSQNTWTGQRAETETELRNRLALLELAVEQEHESSLQVLDALLLQQRQFKQLQAASAPPSSSVRAAEVVVRSQQDVSQLRHSSGESFGTMNQQRRKSSIAVVETALEREYKVDNSRKDTRKSVSGSGSGRNTAGGKF
jgi:hypothetical protein